MAAVAFVGSMGFAASALATETFPNLDDRLRSLEQAIEIQAKKIAEQERMLEHQKHIISEQEKALQQMTSEVKEQRTALQLHLDPEPLWAWAAQGGETLPLNTDYFAEPQYRIGNPVRRAIYRNADRQATQNPGVMVQSAQTKEAAPAQPGEAERRPEILTGIADRGGVLTPTGTLVIEPQLEYLHDSSDRVVIEGFSVLPAILIGSIDVRRVDRDSVIGAVSARYGITDRLEIDAKIPYVYREDTTLSREIAVGSSVADVTDVTGDGIGDVEFGAHYQINDGQNGWPYFIGNLRVKVPTGKDPFEVDVNDVGLQTELPTGSGFWGVEPSVTVLLPSDPIIWWGNIKYLWNVERDVGGGFGTIDPGDAVGATVGIGFAVNRNTSFSLGWEHQFVFDTRQDGRTLEGTDLQLGSFLLGMSYRINESTTVNLSFQGGMTDDATDTRVLIRVPIRFDLL